MTSHVYYVNDALRVAETANYVSYGFHDLKQLEDAWAGFIRDTLSNIQ